MLRLARRSPSVQKPGNLRVDNQDSRVQKKTDCVRGLPDSHIHMVGPNSDEGWCCGLTLPGPIARGWMTTRVKPNDNVTEACTLTSPAYCGIIMTASHGGGARAYDVQGPHGFPHRSNPEPLGPLSCRAALVRDSSFCMGRELPARWVPGPWEGDVELLP